MGGLLALLGAMSGSALLNEAGEINVILSFLLLGEPFLLLLSLISLPMSLSISEKLNTWLVRLGFLNLFLALAQYVLFFILGRHPTGNGNPDYIQGVFYHSGAGHVVSTSVSMSFALYYFVSAKNQSLLLRLGVILAAIFQMLVSDAKQVLSVFLVAGFLLILTKIKNLVEFVKYLFLGVLAGFILWWCVENILLFEAFKTWARPEIYGTNGEATLLKTASIRIIIAHFHSSLNWILGLGPGHTVGRLGGWMIRSYWNLLAPLGVTYNSVSDEVWQRVGESWLGDQSSMFSPLFGWAGIWGDFGFLGLGIYLLLAYLVWHYLCLDDLSRFFLFSIFVFGWIFSQMEEPGYMLFMAFVIGVRWRQCFYSHIFRDNC